MIIVAILTLAGGLSLVLWPDRRVASVEKRIAAGDDRYFEEQRTYRERPSLRNPRQIRQKGIFLMACGAMLLALAFYGKP